MPKTLDIGCYCCVPSEILNTCLRPNPSFGAALRIAPISPSCAPTQINTAETEWGTAGAETLFEDKDGRYVLPARMAARVVQWVRPCDLVAQKKGELTAVFRGKKITAMRTVVGKGRSREMELMMFSCKSVAGLQYIGIGACRLYGYEAAGERGACWRAWAYATSLYHLQHNLCLFGAYHQ